MLASLPAFFGKERYYTIAAAGENKIGFFRAIQQAAWSKPMVGLVGIVFALNFCGTIAGSIALYIVIYHVMGGNVEQGIVLNAMNGTGFAIVGFAGIFALRWLAIKFGKRRAMFLVLGLTALGGVSKWFIFTPDTPYLLLLDAILNGPVWVSLGVLIPSMIADLCDADEYKHGERREGIISSVFTWITKFGTSFTFLVSGIALHFSGFDEKLGADQPEGTMTALRLFFVGASIAAPLLAMLCLKLYNIDEASANQVREELEKRRGEA
jgi:GPH family glycoside/pentoside/hexuronide:cation symporter